MTTTVLLLAILLGGATGSYSLTEPVLQIVGLAACGVLLWSGTPKQRGAVLAGLLLLGALTVVYGILPVSTDAARLGGSGGAIAPTLSIVAALSLLPAIAAFAGILGLTDHQRRDVIFALLLLVMASTFVGLMQIAAGPHSPLRPYAVTNVDDAVGFFANRNHFAAFLYCGLCLGIGWLLIQLEEKPATKPEATEDHLSGRRVFAVVFGSILIVSVLVGVLATRSRAAVALTLLSLIAVLVVAAREASRRQLSRQRMFLTGVLASGVVLALALGLAGVATRFAKDPVADDRVGIASTTWELIWQGLPFGFGLASFETVYTAAENRLDLAPSYTHRAHNDWMELLFETGAFGVILMLAFLIWFMYTCGRVWLGRMTGTQGEILARAGSVVILLLLLHSLVDYPLRTTAMQVVFALACGLLVRAIPEPKPQGTDRIEPPGKPQSLPAVMTPRAPWGGGVTNWPADWR